MRFTGFDSNNMTPISREAIYTYDKANNPKTIQFGGKTFNYTYNKAGQINNISYPNTVSMEKTYDNLDRLSVLDIKSGQNTLVSEKYSYDILGNINSVDRNGILSSYKYDKKNQLVSEIFNDNSGDANKILYIYDGTGNRIKKEQYSGMQTKETEYGINSLNQLESVS